MTRKKIRQSKSELPLCDKEIPGTAASEQKSNQTKNQNRNRNRRNRKKFNKNFTDVEDIGLNKVNKVNNNGSGHETKEEATAKISNKKKKKMMKTTTSATVECNIQKLTTKKSIAENNSHIQSNKLQKGIHHNNTTTTTITAKTNRRSRREKKSGLCKDSSRSVHKYIDMTWAQDANGYDLMDTRRAKLHRLTCTEFKEELRKLMANSSDNPKLNKSQQFEESSAIYETNCDKLGATSDAQRTDKIAHTVKFDAEKALSLIDFEIFGSTTMDLVIPGSSDVDINVKFNCDNPLKELGFEYKRHALDMVLKQIQEHSRFKVVEVRRFARVPVIKVKYTALNNENLLDEDMQDINGDITFSHSLPRYNSNLLRAYGQWNPMLRKLMMIVKYWSSQRGIKDASKGYLSSYSFMLLAIFYGQLRMGVPNLQMENSKVMKKFGIKSLRDVSALIPVNESGWKRIKVVEFPELNDKKTSNSNSNTMSATDHCLLLLDFLEFIDHLPLHSHCVSVRTASLVPKPQRQRLRGEDWRWSIEDPFEHFESNAPRDLGCVLKESSVFEVHQEIDRAIILLRSWYYEDSLTSKETTSIDVDNKEHQASNILKQLFHKKAELLHPEYNDVPNRDRSKDLVNHHLLLPVIDDDSNSEYNNKLIKIGDGDLRVISSTTTELCSNSGQEDWEFRPSFSSSSMSMSDHPSEIDENANCVPCPTGECQTSYLVGKRLMESEQHVVKINNNEVDEVQERQHKRISVPNEIVARSSESTSRCDDGVARNILMEALGCLTRN